jgi:hypothetical protein
MNIHSAVQPSIKPLPKARSYYESTSVIELWLSVPRLLGVWPCRLCIFFFNITYMRKSNRQNSDFVLLNTLDDLIEYYIWYVKNEGKTLTFTKDVTIQ